VSGSTVTAGAVMTSETNTAHLHLVVPSCPVARDPAGPPAVIVRPGGTGGHRE
jgi:hypothetical protein